GLARRIRRPGRLARRIRRPGRPAARPCPGGLTGLGRVRTDGLARFVHRTTSSVYSTDTDFQPHARTRMRVMIVDDHPITRSGLRSALSNSDEIDVVGEASSGEEAIDVVGEIKPEVVFMDVRMPGMGGLEATKIIKEVSPDTKVILFTVEESRSAIADAI